MKKVCSTLLALVLVISMLAVGCDPDFQPPDPLPLPQPEFPDRPDCDPGVLCVNQYDDFSVQSWGAADLTSLMIVEKGPLAKMYWDVYEWEYVETKLDPEVDGGDRMEETGEQGALAFKKDYWEQLREIYRASTGIQLPQDYSGIGLPEEFVVGDVFWIQTTALAPLATPIDYAAGQWVIPIMPCGGDDAGTDDSGIMMTQLMFKKLLLRSTAGYNSLVWTNTMSFTLPEGAEVTNRNEIHDLIWTLDFGGEDDEIRTTRQAKVQVSSDGTKVYLTETTRVCQAPLEPGEDLLRAYLGGGELPPYRTFTIEYQLPTSTAFVDSLPHEAPCVTLSSGGADWRWSWSPKFSWAPSNLSINETVDLEDIPNPTKGIEVSGTVTLKAGPFVDVTPFVGVTWKLFTISDFGLWLDVEPWAGATIEGDVSGEFEHDWEWLNRRVYTKHGGFLVFLVPVKYSIYFHLYAGTEVDFEGKAVFSAEYKVGAAVTVGYRYDGSHRGIWRPRLTHHSTPLGEIIDKLEAEVTVMPYVKLRLGLNLYEVAGVFLDGIPKGKLWAEFDDDEEKVTWSIEGGGQVDIGVHAGIADLLEIVGLSDRFKGAIEGATRKPAPSGREWSYTILGPELWPIAGGEIAWVMHDLTIVEATEGGTTYPQPGTHRLKQGTEQPVRAIPASPGWEFHEWTGDAESTDSEITVIMDMDKTITPHFRIPADLYASGDGTLQNPFQIENWVHLHNIRYHPTLHFVLVDDLGSDTVGYADLAGPSAHGGKGWQPIGEWGDRFTGTFDGGGMIISDLHVERAGENDVGLFGVVGPGGKIRATNLSDVWVSGAASVGGLVGRLESGGELSHSTIMAASEVYGSSLVGGLVGVNHGTIEDSVAASTEVTSVLIVDAYATSIGGLVGANHGSVANSRATDGYVLGPVMEDGAYRMFIGGLVGDNSGTITRSYAANDVELRGSNWFVGGLVGQNTGLIENCYATGKVDKGGTESGDTSHVVGGLVGQNGCTGKVRSSYATGEVVGDDWVGGLVGVNFFGEVSHSFWDTVTSNQPESAGGTGKATVEMKNIVTFSDAGWNIVGVVNAQQRDPLHIWNIVDKATYPFLSWEPILVP